MSQTLHRTKLRAPAAGTAVRYLRSVPAAAPNRSWVLRGNVRSPIADLKLLERLIPSENGVTVLDAETQETSYGICVLDGLPYIFDTHRKDRFYVATIELLTEVLTPVRISVEHVRAFCRDSRARGLLPIPYSGCFFKGNLHVYSFRGPVRGFDLATVGTTAAQSERNLTQRVDGLWPDVPPAITRAQRELLRGRRRARHAADLEVLLLPSRGRRLRPASSAYATGSQRSLGQACGARKVTAGNRAFDRRGESGLTVPCRIGAPSSGFEPETTRLTAGGSTRLSYDGLRRDTGRVLK